MSDTTLPATLSVDNDHHNRHSGDVGDGGDDESLLLQSLAAGISASESTVAPDDDPVVIIEAALIRLKDDVGVLAEEVVVQAFSVLKATDMPTFLRLRQQAKVTNRDCSITILDKLVRDELPGGGEEPSVLDELVALARNQCQLKHDADRTAVAIIPMPGRQEVWHV